MFANSPNENVSQQYSHFTHILGWSVIHLQSLPPKKFVGAWQNRCTRFVLFGNRTHRRSFAQKEKHNVEPFIVEMKHIMVPLVNVLNTLSKVVCLEKEVSFIVKLTFSLCVFPLFLLFFHVVSRSVPVLILWCTGKQSLYYQTIKYTSLHLKLTLLYSVTS